MTNLCLSTVKTFNKHFEIKKIFIWKLYIEENKTFSLYLISLR